MNRIKLYALAALAGISATVIPVLTASVSFNSNVNNDTREYIEALPISVVYGETLHITDGEPDDSAPLINTVNGTFALSAAADKLTPTTGSKTFASTTSSDNSFVYFRQNSPEYKNIPYGNRTIGSYGCGPTNMAIVITSLTGNFTSPVTLAKQSEEWGCFVSGSGTSHAFFPKSASYYGIKYEQFNYSKQAVIEKLKAGKMIVCTMGKGYFSNGGHYITLRGITDDGMILIADTYSEENTYKEWTLDFLASQLKYGSMWSFWK